MADKKHPEYQYLDLCQDILDNGADKELFFNDVVLEEYKKKGEKPPFIRLRFWATNSLWYVWRLSTSYHQANLLARDYYWAVVVPIWFFKPQTTGRPK